MPQLRLRPPSKVRLISLGIAGIALLFVAPVFSQDVSQDQFAKIAVAQRFVRALYPEVKDKGYVMTIVASGPFDSDWDSPPDFGISVGPTEQRLNSGVNAQSELNRYWEKPEILRAGFHFRKGGRLVESASVEFSPLESRFKLIEAEVNSHQQWSDEQVIAAMKKAGAKFGPNDRDALMAVVPLAALEPFIGKFQIQSSEFHLRHEQSPRSLAQLYWEVDGESVRQMRKRLTGCSS